MYISKVSIRNFRAFDDVGISATFNKGVNAIIGENNTGKSAFVDALRIAFSTTLYKKDIYFNVSDFHIDNRGIRSETASFDIFFDEVPEVEPAKIVKHKEFELDRISDEQAVEQIELLDNDFYIYKDMETGNVNVLYRRADGDYGVIKTK